jgi:hypothetical protein
LLILHDVLDLQIGTKQVAVDRTYGSVSNVSRRVSECTGRSIRDWKYQGGFAAALLEYSRLWHSSGA